jgi:CheY-like chemotaxis protein
MRPVAGRPADRGNVMIVDDNPANLKLLEDMLRQQGHEVHAFPRGRMALQAAARNPPDLILLDINMPEMNGYEVCERLKSSDPVAGIPVIFRVLSAKLRRDAGQQVLLEEIALRDPVMPVPDGLIG